jgi:hypothetical protein
MFFWVFPRRQIVVGQLQFDAGEIPERTYTIFKPRRKFEILGKRLKILHFVGFYGLVQKNRNSYTSPNVIKIARGRATQNKSSLMGSRSVL